MGAILIEIDVSYREQILVLRGGGAGDVLEIYQSSEAARLIFYYLITNTQKVFSFLLFAVFGKFWEHAEGKDY